LKVWVTNAVLVVKKKIDTTCCMVRTTRLPLAGMNGQINPDVSVSARLAHPDQRIKLFIEFSHLEVLPLSIRNQKTKWRYAYAKIIQPVRIEPRGMGFL